MPEAEQLLNGDSPLNTVNFTPKTVSEKLKKLNPNSAPGPDGIWTRILHSTADIISEPLAYIYTKCLDNNTKIIFILFLLDMVLDKFLVNFWPNPSTVCNLIDNFFSGFVYLLYV